MSKTPPNLADLPPEVQALFAAQAAELGRKDAEMLGLSLTHAAAQKRLKAEMASVGAALSAERTAHAQAIQNRDTIICACNFTVTKNTALAPNQKTAHSWRLS